MKFAKHVARMDLGSVRVSRVGFGVAPKRTLLWILPALGAEKPEGKVRDREDAIASRRDACATRFPLRRFKV